MGLLLAVLYLVYGFFVLYVIVQMVLRLALIDILLALAPIALGLWILPHTAGWGRHWLRLFMTTTFQQAIQLIALAMGLGFLNEVAAIAAFEPVQDLIWKLLMSLAFVYMATRVPSLLGQRRAPSTRWLSMLYFGMNLPASFMRSAKTIGLVAGGATGGSGRRMAVGAMAASAGLSAAAGGLSSAASMATPSGRWSERGRWRAAAAAASSSTGTTKSRRRPKRCAGRRSLSNTRPIETEQRKTRISKRGEKEWKTLHRPSSNLVGILLGVVGTIGVGFFIYGAYLYLTASGSAPPDGARQERNDDGPRRHRPGPGRLRSGGAGDERRRGQPRHRGRRRAARPGHANAVGHPVGRTRGEEEPNA